jgi:hypothetical protein
VKAAAHGGQVLVTQTTRDLVADRLGSGFSLRRLGEFRLRDLSQPELVYQLTHPDLPSDFPPIRTLAERTSNLPMQVSSFIGRERGAVRNPGVDGVVSAGDADGSRGVRQDQIGPAGGR